MNCNHEDLREIEKVSGKLPVVVFMTPFLVYRKWAVCEQ